MYWEKLSGRTGAAQFLTLMVLLLATIAIVPHGDLPVAGAALTHDDPELDCMAAPDDSRCTPATPRDDDWHPAPPLHCPGTIPDWPPWCRSGQG